MTTANLSTATTSFDAMPPGPLGASLHYAVRTATLTLKTWSYVLFTIGMPVILYLVFNGLWGSQPIAPASTTPRSSWCRWRPTARSARR